MHIVSGAAGAAEATGDERMHDDGITHRDIAHRRANCLDPARVLVPPRIRQGHAGFLSPLALDDMKVGATKTCTTDTYNHVMWPCDLRLSNLHDARQLIIFKQAYSFHARSPLHIALPVPFYQRLARSVSETYQCKKPC